MHWNGIQNALGWSMVKLKEVPYTYRASVHKTLTCNVKWDWEGTWKGYGHMLLKLGTRKCMDTCSWHGTCHWQWENIGHIQPKAMREHWAHVTSCQTQREQQTCLPCMAHSNGMGTWYMFMTITRGGANMCTFQAHANDISIRRKKRRVNMCTLHDTC